LRLFKNNLLSYRLIYSYIIFYISLWLIFQALKEAFEIFCNKTVAGSSSAELLATFCDNILKKGGSEKLSDEGIEETLEKVVLGLFISLCFSMIVTKII